MLRSQESLVDGATDGRASALYTFRTSDDFSGYARYKNQSLHSRPPGTVKVGEEREGDTFTMPNQVLDDAGSHEMPHDRGDRHGSSVGRGRAGQIYRSHLKLSDLPISEFRIALSSPAWNERAPPWERTARAVCLVEPYDYENLAWRPSVSRCCVASGPDVQNQELEREQSMMLMSSVVSRWQRDRVADVDSQSWCSSGASETIKVGVRGL